MDYSYGQKLEVKAVLKLEIKGQFPKGQPLQVTYSDEPNYNVLVNGVPVYLKKSVLDAIISAAEPQSVPHEPSEAEKSEIADEMQGEQPKKRGRPAGK